MSSKKATLTPRAANKAAREKRRDEIMKRWNKRVSVRILEDYLTRDDATTHGLVNEIIYQAQWSSTIVLAFALDYEKINVKNLVSYLIRLVELKEMPYDEYLQTPEWKRRADACKKSGECALDARHPAEHAHHRTYERRGREYPTDLVPLCADCHAKHHGRRS